MGKQNLSDAALVERLGDLLEPTILTLDPKFYDVSPDEHIACLVHGRPLYAGKPRGVKGRLVPVPKDCKYDLWYDLDSFPQLHAARREEVRNFIEAYCLEKVRLQS